MRCLWRLLVRSANQLRFRDVNGRPDKVAVQLRALAYADNIVPKLLTMALLPTVGALKDRDDELLRTF